MAEIVAFPSRLTVSDRLRRLSQRIGRLGIAGRTDPETVVIEKMDIAREIRAIARDLERREYG